MSENNQPNMVANDRRRRINRLKKIIVITALILILIPIVLCIVLMVKISGMQKTIDELMDLKNTGAIVAQHDNAGKTYYVYASQVPDKPQAADKDVEASAGQQEDYNAEKDEEQPLEAEQPDTGRYVYLTFDDGPSTQTKRIIEILDEYNVTATFFVVGAEDEKSIELYKSIVESGNSIGLHSYTHDYEKVYANVESFADDVQRISDLVYNATGVRSKLYRFPGGSSNAIADDINVFINYLNENGYTYYDWNSSSRDAASAMPAKEDIINTVMAETEGKDNVVVLMHDSIRKESTVEALPELIEKLKAKGFTIRGIDENSVPVQHR